MVKAKVEQAGRAEFSPPTRCRGEQWYLLRGRSGGVARDERAQVQMRFLRRGEVLGERAVRLSAIALNGSVSDLLGWVQTPAKATHLQIAGTQAGEQPHLADIDCHPVSERDPKCHPLANVPRWDRYRPPFPIERVLLSEDLAELQPLLTGLDVRPAAPKTKGALATEARAAACVLDPAWVARLRLTWRDIERLAAESWLIIDLETAWRLLRQARRVPAELITQSTPHGIMSARVEYADVPTRGFALQDVFPYTTIGPDGEFSVRILRADRAWKAYADETGFATLLASETPAPQHCGDVLSAARAIGRGELIVTDLPWLVAGRQGHLLAPRLARHALRMHLGAPFGANVQHWNRWEDGLIIVRDIADLTRRYPPLRTMRWPEADGGVSRLGVWLPAERSADAPTLVFETGRIDCLDRHDGLPSEPMIIFMKMLARDARERTPWARRYLSRLNVVWQFDSAAGGRYAVNYEPAAVNQATRIVRITSADAPADQIRTTGGEAWARIEVEDEGLLGDGSIELQAGLDARLRLLIERAAT